MYFMRDASGQVTKERLIPEDSRDELIISLSGNVTDSIASSLWD